MPTLQELTLAHSRRLSEISRTRDVSLAAAQRMRDDQLRALPTAAKAFQKYDDELAAAREKQLSTEGKAEAARASALLAAVDRRGDRFEDAQMARRTADVEAVQTRRRLEGAAEARYLAAVNGAREGPEERRSQALLDADRQRRLDLEQARRAHDEAFSASQQAYRGAVDEAMLGERRANRDSERAYFDALRLTDAAARAARTAADQTLLAALAGLPGARDILREWRGEVARIGAETATAEQEEFSRFRRELQALKV